MKKDKKERRPITQIFLEGMQKINKMTPEEKKKLDAATESMKRKWES